jgi:tetratricopeptide (TPR) repeat protein
MTRLDFVRAGILLFCAALVLVAAGCGDDESSFFADPGASQIVATLSEKVASGAKPSSEDTASIRSIYEKYPTSKTVREIYKRVLIGIEDWHSLEQFLSAAPASDRNADHDLLLGKVYMKLGRYDDAVGILKSLPQEMDDERASMLGNAYFRLGKYAEAASILDANWKLISDRKNLDGLITRGLVYFHVGKNEKAIEVLNSALAVDQNSIAANNALNRIYAKLGDEEKAREYSRRVENAYAKMTENERGKTRMVDRFYRLREAFDGKQYAEAITLAKELLDTADPRSKVALYQYLYGSYKALGMQKDADEILLKAKELGSK